MSSAEMALAWEADEAVEVERRGAWEGDVDAALEGELEEAARAVARHIEEDEPAILPAAFERAEAFLRAQSRESRKLFRRFPRPPVVSPGPNGSADLHWEGPGRGLLVNVPADDSLATFYGDREGGGRIKGSLDPRQPDLEIISWLSRM